MPMNTASYSSSSCSMLISRPISVFRRNSIPMPVKTSRRRAITVFSSLNSGIPKVSRPAISGLRSNTTGLTPARTSTSAQPSPAGPAPMMATRLPLGLTWDISGRQPMAKAVSVMYFSTEPMVTAPKPSFRVQAPSQTVLRTDATTDFRQGVGLVRQLCRLDDVALGYQLQPVRDVVVYRTLPLAVGVAALQAAVRLLGSLLRLEQLVDLDKAGLALPQRTLLRLLPTHFDKLEVVVRTLCHVPPLHCRCAAAHQRKFIVTQPLTAGWPAWFSAKLAGSLPWA